MDAFGELSVSFSGHAKTIVKSGVGVIGLKVTNLFEDVVGVSDVEKGIGEVAMSFTEVLENFPW